MLLPMAKGAGVRDEATRSRRAAPLAPTERRAAIIEATIPLLREHGPDLTTRRIAEAAEVAEGTIFNVFPDKETLIASAIEAAMDPSGTIERVRGIDSAMPLEQRTREAVAALQQRFADIWRLLTAVGPGAPQPPTPTPNQAFVSFGDALASVLAPDAAQLRLSPTDAARALLAVTLGCSHPAVNEQSMEAEEIVQLFLNGVGRQAQ
jgi:AcrR family transcriptional regulator